MMASQLRSRSWPARLALPVLLATLVACGGDDGESTPADIAEADAMDASDVTDAADTATPDITIDVARPDVEREPHIVDSIEPTRGDIAGRTTIDIRGENFPELCSVRFGQVPSVPATTLSDELIVVDTPAGIEAGFVDVTVRCSGVDVVLPDAFEYFTPIQPIITDISPLVGRIEGGELVTITGSALVPGARNLISFGGEFATDIEFVDEQTITVLTPAQVPGPASIIVELGSQRATVNESFTFLQALTATAVTPGFADARGGSDLTLFGIGLWPFAGVEIEVGGVAADPTTFEYDEFGASVNFVSPATDVRGVTDVVVRTLLDEATLEEALTLLEPVAVADVSPDAVPTTDGQRVILTGDGAPFDAEAFPLTVLLGEFEAFAVSWDSDTQISFLVPPLDAGEYTITLIHGIQVLQLEQTLTLFDTITVDDITPNNGAAAGGTRVDITGSGFVDSALVFFGDAQGTSVAVSSDGASLSVTTPPGAGVVDVTVRTRFSTATLADAFAYGE